MRSRIEFRVNPKLHKHEKVAVEVVEHYEEQGFSVREIVVEALLALGNVKLTRRTQFDHIAEKLDALQEQVASQQAAIQAIIFQALRGLDLSQFVAQNGQNVQQALTEKLGGRVPDDVLAGMLNPDDEMEF